MEQVVSALRKISSAKYAKNMSRYFKTGVGEYGHGDVFLGVRMPQLRDLLKTMHDNIQVKDAVEMLQNEFHEVRMFGALWFVDEYKLNKKNTGRKQEVYDEFCKHFDRLNNWDLVDCSAPQLVGVHLMENGSVEGAIETLLGFAAKSDCLWTRRVGMLSCFPFVKRNEFRPALTLSKYFLDMEESEDLMHKATGWMLREVGKRDEATLLEFLDQNHTRMPRVMVRYSIEKLSSTQREKYLQKSKRSNEQQEEKPAPKKRRTRAKT